MKPSQLFRWSGIMGIVSGSLIILDNLFIDTFFADNPLLNIFGVLGTLLILFLLMGLYINGREKSGMFGLISFFLNSLGVIALFGLAFTQNYILNFLSAQQVDDLLMGPTQFAFLLSAVTLLVGVLLFGAMVFQTRLTPRIAAILYMLGFIPVSLRPFFPEPVFLAGQFISALAIIWFGYSLWSQSDQTSTLEHSISPA